MPSNFKRYAPKLFKLGYEPVPIQVGEKAPRGKSVVGWTKDDISPERLRQWNQAYPDAGVGIRTGKVWAIDVDIDDEEISNLIREQFKFTRSEVERRSGSNRFLIVVRGEPGKKKRASTKYHDLLTGHEHRIEVLRQGQQFVAYHTHPKTGKEYNYPEDNLADTPFEDLINVDEKYIDALFDYFDDVAPAHWEKTGKRKDAAPESSENVLVSSSPKVDKSFEEVCVIIAELPNDDIDYEDWLNIGAAIHHQTDGSRAGFNLWTTYSAKSGKHDASLMKTKWRSFGNYSGAL